MTTNNRDHAVWTLDLTVSHDPGFQHRIKLCVLGQRGGWTEVARWEWKGLGVPAPLVTDIQARVDSVIAEHLATRYGIAGLLSLRWAGDPEPS